MATQIAISPIWNQQHLDANGNPLVGGKIYAYVAGSASTLQAIYNSSGSMLANPLTLDSSGRPTPFYLDLSKSYNLVLTNSAGSVIASADNVFGGQSAAQTQSIIDSSGGSFLPLTGGGVTGNLSVSGTTQLHNTAVQGTLSASGAVSLGATTATSVTGALDANSKVITNVATPVATTDGANKAYVDTAAGALIPAGVVMPYAGYSNTPPDGFYFCFGQSISRTTDPLLFAAIGTVYGAADSNTFNVPDYRGTFLRGRDGGRGKDPDTNRDIGSFQQDASQQWISYIACDERIPGKVAGAVQADSGTIRSEAVAAGCPNASVNTSGGGSNTPNYMKLSNSLTTRTSSETRPSNYAVNFIISRGMKG